jgi:Putative DNA-binding domain
MGRRWRSRPRRDLGSRPGPCDEASSRVSRVTIFGLPWEELELEHVERFLARAGREPLTWEAKGREIRPGQVTKHVCGFANAAEGGYLLFGVELVDDEWRASGFAFPGDDPPAWVSNIVRETLRPRPGVDVRSWDVGDGKRAAVVRIDPVAEPPCVTSGGQLYERVSGETIPVRDPGDVRALYERGQAATERAEANALRAVRAVMEGVDLRGALPEIEEDEVGEEPFKAPVLVLALAAAPVGTASDLAAKVFAPDIEERLVEAAAALPHNPLFPEYGFREGRVALVSVAQDSVSFTTTPTDAVHSWDLRVGWDGSVVGLLRVAPRRGVEATIVISDHESLLSDALFNDGIRPLAELVENTARGIGGSGRAHVVLDVVAVEFSLHHGALRQQIPGEGELRPIQRWADSDPWLGEHLLESMKRELLRACGFPEWEPIAAE